MTCLVAELIEEALASAPEQGKVEHSPEFAAFLAWRARPDADNYTCVPLNGWWDVVGLHDDAGEFGGVLIRRKTNTRWVYVLQDEGNARIKIGHTSGSPEKRRRKLQTGSSSRLELLFVEAADDFTEKHLQQLMRRFLIPGRIEWFHGACFLPLMEELTRAPEGMAYLDWMRWQREDGSYRHELRNAHRLVLAAKRSRLVSNTLRHVQGGFLPFVDA